MHQLIQKTDFSTYIDMAANMDTLKINVRVLEAQNFDLKPLLGKAMYYDLMDHYADVNYQNIINGVDKEHQGLIPVLVYFSTARLIRALDFHITPHGNMYKRNEYSDHVSTKEVGQKATEMENLALAYWNDVAGYINTQGKDIYPLYDGFSTCGSKEVYARQRIIGIKGSGLGGRNYGYR